MSAYLLSCPCGETVPVDVGQAGGQVTCSCGTQLDVPPLRQLRHLPRATAPEEPRSRGTWGARQGIVATSLILAAALFLWSGYVWWKQPTIPKFDPASRLRAVEAHIATPAGAYEAWIEYYRPMAEHGIPIFRVANAADIEARMDSSRFLRWMLWVLVALFVIVALAVAYWPAAPQRTTRRLDH